MNRLRWLRSVRGRLLALMAIVIVPLAVLSVTLAAVTFQSVIVAIEASQLQMTSDYAVRTRIWFRGMLRSLVTTSILIEADPSRSARCSAALGQVLSRMDGWNALRIKFSNGDQCFAATDAALSADIADRIVADQKKLPLLEPWAGQKLADFRYDSVKVGDRTELLVFAHHKNADGSAWEAMLMVSPTLLHQAFGIGANETKSATALVRQPNDILVMQDTLEGATGWLPASQIKTPALSRWEGVSQNGETETYASQLVAGPSLFILSRFDNAPLRAASTQFLILCVTPLLILALLTFAYARAIQFNILRWIKGIEIASRSRTENPRQLVLAPVDPSMPDDMREVALAFNSMLEEGAQREKALQEALDANNALMRELHHRVKNSLQVIQSYLALSRRQDRAASAELIESEARVQVLSVAYRLALAETGTQPSDVAVFTTEIVNTLAAMLEPRRPRITASVSAHANLVVEQLIPLGLAIVEGVLAASRTPDVKAIRVDLHALASGQLGLVVSGDCDRHMSMPQPKIMQALAVQLAADVNPAAAGQTVNWSFSA